jgi:hypothetical protein
MAEERDEVVVRTRRVSPLLIVLLAIVVLAALWFLVIGPLLPDDEDVGVPEAIPTPVEESPRPEPSPTRAPPETFEVFESKDPFRPLVVAEAEQGATVTAGTGAAPGTAPDGTASDGAAPPPGQGAGGAPAPSGGQRVALLDVLEENGEARAQVKVGSTVFTVSPGEVFADNFKLVSISGSCATFLHGDDKFTLCEGEEVIK